MIAGRTLSALGVLLVFGLVRLPVERSIEQDLRDRGFRAGMVLPDQASRDQLGQAGVAAMLGGFRSFLATAFELRAITSWYDADYESVEVFYNMATQLQPREPGYWEMAAWMMESNAASHYSQAVFGESRLERRRRLEKVPLARARGKKFLENGLVFNPEDYVLNRAFAIYFGRREQNFCEAAEYYKRAAAAQSGFTSEHRQAAYAMSLCPGKEAEAYQLLRDIHNRTLSLYGYLPESFVVNCRYLEGFLEIPEADRLPFEFDFKAFYEFKLKRFREETATNQQRILLDRLKALSN